MVVSFFVSSVGVVVSFLVSVVVVVVSFFVYYSGFTYLPEVVTVVVVVVTVFSSFSQFLISALYVEFSGHFEHLNVLILKYGLLYPQAIHPCLLKNGASGVQVIGTRLGFYFL